jgi:uncharacterized protein YsxB (DUF464 family)
MTEFRFYRGNGGGYVRVEISGHSGYAEAGSDIVCAAVSSAVRYLDVLANDTLLLGIPITVNDDAAMTLSMPDKLSPEVKRHCMNILSALYTYAKQLESEYPENIKVVSLTPRSGSAN